MMPCMIFVTPSFVANKFNMTYGACFLGAGMLLLLPVRWWLGALMAAAVHELSHLAAVILTGGKLLRMEISALGAKIETTAMGRPQELLCAAAGPMGSLLFAFAAADFPEGALCAVIQGLYNLLPIFPLDGGRIIRLVLPGTVCHIIEWLMFGLLFGLGIWGCVRFDMGFLPLFPPVTVGVKLVKRKFSCKEPKFAVQ